MSSTSDKQNAADAVKLLVRFDDEQALQRHLDMHRTQGAVLLQTLVDPPELTQYQRVTLEIVDTPSKTMCNGEVLQVIDNVGVVVRLDCCDELLQLWSQRTSEASADKKTRHAHKAGLLSWTIEKLQTEWSTFTLAEKMRLAKHGKLHARRYIVQTQDKALIGALLSNPKIGADEVAAIANIGSLDVSLLKRIVNSPEWTRHAAVARNLVCHPKVSLPQATKLLDKLGTDELRRLAKGGRVRASLKRVVMQKLLKRG